MSNRFEEPTNVVSGVYSLDTNVVSGVYSLDEFRCKTFGLL